MALFATHPIQYHAPWYRALVDEGVDLHVFFALLPSAAQQAVGFGGGFVWDIPILDGYRWSVLPQLRRRPSLGSFLGLRSGGVGRAMAEMAPDAVVVTGWNSLPLMQAAWTAILLKIPTIVRGESNGLAPRTLWKRSAHHALLSLFTAYVSIGKANRAFYEASGVPEEKIFDGGYFVDNSFFRRMAERDLPRRKEFRRQWGIPEGATCFLFSGKLQPKKRPFDFLSALGLASSRQRPGAVHGLVVGRGEVEGEMRASAGAARLPVTFAGFLNQTEIGRAYASADAVVLPSDFGETWGLVVNEGMLFRLPAIVSDRVGSGPDLVTHGETGLVFPFADVAALAERMTDLSRNPERRQRMGTEARARVAGYSPTRGAKAVTAAVRTILAGG